MAGVSGVTVNNVFSAFSGSVTNASKSLEDAIKKAGENASDPTNLIAMQQQLSNYNMAMQVQSSVMKSIEDTAKSITQKL